MNEPKGTPSNWKVRDTPQDCGLVPTVAVALWLGWNGVVLWTILYAAFVAGTWQRTAILGAVVLSLALPPDFPDPFGRRAGDWIMLQAEKYFGLKTVIEDEEGLLRHAKQNKALIFSFNPHDVLPYSVFSFNPILRRLPGKIGEDGTCLMTSAVFRLPFIRQVYSWVACRPVDKQTFLSRLIKGESFVFCPGGVQEVLMLNPDRPRDIALYLKRRKGFVKLALQTGSPIVPVFGFGLDGSFGCWIPRGRFVERLSRSTGFVPLVYWGRWFVPFGIPNPQKITVVIGSAIDVPKQGDGVAQEDVDKYHGIFLDELEKLFERHKDEAGYGDRKLKII